MDHLVGSHEIGVMLGGVSRQRVHQLTSRPDFPRPVARLSMGSVWRTEDVEQWMARRASDVRHRSR